MRCGIGLLFASLARALAPAAAPAKLFAKYKQQCALAGVVRDDPLVAPGQEGGADHNHGWSGSRAFSSTVTTGQAMAADTTCFLRSNHAMYWAPTMDKDGVSYGGSFGGYYAGNGADPAAIAGGKIIPFPIGFSKLIRATPGNVRWRCGQSVSPTLTPPPVSCGQSFSMEIDDPSPCWDGTHLDVPDHASHTAPAVVGGGCPAAFPWRLPQIQAAFTYPAAALGGRLSSDHDLTKPAGYSAHFDVIEVQDVANQDQLTRCLNDPARNSVNSPSCGVFTYLPNPWESRVSAWAQVVGYVDSQGNPTYGMTPPVTP